MSEELLRLWRLGEIDERIAASRARLRKYPEQRKALESRAAAERARLQAHQKTTAERQLTRRKLEQEIDAVSAQQRQYESRQPSVKTNEEYQALSHEIAGCKAKRSDLETRVLLTLEDEEKLAAEGTAIERALQAAEAELASRLGEIAAEERAEGERLAAHEGERAREMKGLPAPTRQRYERVHASRDGKAVVPIVKNSCGGCFRQQPPQTLQEARRGERVLTCEGCGSLMVWPPEGA